MPRRWFLTCYKAANAPLGERELRDFADNGWRLVSVVRHSGAYCRDGVTRQIWYYHYFERPRPPIDWRTAFAALRLWRHRKP